MFKDIRNRDDWDDKSVSEKGFTLIELLVVIAILGILAVVGVLSFAGLTDSAYTATNSTELTQVQTAVAAYRATHDGAVPADTAALVPGQIAASAHLTCTYTIAPADEAAPSTVKKGDVGQTCP